MIAAAAAAMIGGAYADDTTNFVYDVKATFKTTVGATTKGSKTSFNIGKNKTDALWYRDAAITDVGTTDWSADGAVQTNQIAGVPGVYVIKYEKDGKGYLAYKDGKDLVVLSEKEMKKNALSGVSEETRAAFAKKFASYNQKSAGQWCVSGSYKIGGCYRKAGSYKFTGYGMTETCCDSGDFDLVLYDKDMKDLSMALESVIFNRFGSIDYTKATKIDYAASVGTFGGADAFALAGQGTWATNLKIDGETVAGVSSISGNIVGALDAPTCENCCDDDTEAVAFDCEGADNSSEPTAAYGTFTIKFNKKLSSIE